MDILKLYGLRLKTLRLGKGLSQEKLAELSELHRTYISSIELGKRNISLKNIQAISNALDVPIEKFFTDIQSRNEHEVD